MTSLAKPAFSRAASGTAAEKTIDPQPQSLVTTFHRNFEVVVADSPALVDEALQLRYQVYCLERGFEDPGTNCDGRERDEYDSRSVHAVIRHRGTGMCSGAVRLVLSDRLSPDRPFPIEAHCGQSFYDGVPRQIAEVPRGRIAEISRFAVSREFRRRAGEMQFVHGMSPHTSYTDRDVQSATMGRRNLPHITIGLFAAIVRLTIRHNVTHWFAVMEPSLLRLLRPFGIEFPAVGPLMDYHGRRRPTFAPADQVVAGILVRRPDVWDIITDHGAALPPCSSDDLSVVQAAARVSAAE